MKSGKQRQAEIKAKRTTQRAKAAASAVPRPRRPLSPGQASVNESALAPYNSYGTPAFAMRGYYEDTPFHCAGCGKDEVWTATQQKWWFEVAKGYPYSTAKLCRACRRREQARRAEARRVHLEGIERKQRRAK